MYKQQASPKYYIYSPDGKKGKYIQTSKTDENKFEGPLPDPLKLEFLKSNPFLYNPEEALFPVLSIEEFLVDTGRQYLPLGDIIRNPEFKLSKRKRIIKNAFRVWNKDYNKKKNTAFVENDKMVEIIGDLGSLKFSYKAKLLLWFLLIITVFVVGINSYLWEKFSRTTLGNYFYSILYKMYSTSTWLRAIGNITIYLTLLTIFYSFIYSMISRDFNKNYRLAESYLDRSETTISRSYKKKWRKARRYYLKGIKNKKNPYFPPLGIESVQEGQINIAIFKQICQVLVDRAYKYKKSKPFVNVLKHVLITLCTAGTSILLIFLIYHMILSIFR